MIDIIIAGLLLFLILIFVFSPLFRLQRLTLGSWVQIRSPLNDWDYLNERAIYTGHVGVIREIAKNIEYGVLITVWFPVNDCEYTFEVAELNYLSNDALKKMFPEGVKR